MTSGLLKTILDTVNLLVVFKSTSKYDIFFFCIITFIYYLIQRASKYFDHNQLIERFYFLVQKNSF